MGAAAMEDRPTLAWAFLGLLLAVRLLIYLISGGANPLHGDEYYFIACGQHLAWGYVDHPPFAPFLALLTDTLLGASPMAMHFLPFVAGCLTILLTMLLARELGGKAVAQGLSGLGILVAPVFLRTGATFCIPAIEPVFWLGASLLVARLLRTERHELWLLVGVVAGLGLLNKHLMAIWGVGLTVGLLATAARRELLRPWLWLGGVAAFLIFLPHLYWQQSEGWPSLEFIEAMREGYAEHEPPIMLLVAQILYLSPAGVLLWGPGLVFGFRRTSEAGRVLAFIAPVAFLILLATGGKPYYFAPAAPLLLVFGGLFWEQRMAQTGRPRSAILTAGALSIAGLVLLPVASPLLPLPLATRYADALVGAVTPPDELLDEFHAGYGYPEQYEAAVDIYSRLPASEQAQCLYLASNFSRAGVADLMRRTVDGPPPASGHMNYFLWGVPEGRGEVAIACGYPREVLEALYKYVEVAAVVHAPLARPWERERELYLCRGLKRDLEAVWPYFKHYSNHRSIASDLAAQLAE